MVISDLVVGNRDGDLAYFRNAGTAGAPAFTQRTGTANPFDSISTNSNSAPELADLDDDGDYDLVLWGWYGRVNYYENTGTAVRPQFVARSDASDPLNSLVLVNSGKPSFTDLDDDGDLDLVARNLNSPDFRYFEYDSRATEPGFVTTVSNIPNSLTLYDNGGNDTLDVRTDRHDQFVDLRPEGISDVYGLKSNLAIARDVSIENVIAGSGNDVIIGNTADNRLEGRRRR